MSNNEESFSDKLMGLTKLLQESNKEQQKHFGLLFMAANKLAESGFTQEQLQLIAITAFQCHDNPQLKQMFQLLMGGMEIDSNGEYH
jgi:hypothetical protein